MFDLSNRTNPPRVIVLSPHRDDAAFSCGLLMTRLLRAGAAVQMVNVLTRSDYAPYLESSNAPRELPGASRVEEVSAVRRAEDLAFLRALQQAAGSHPCSMTDLQWLDSPLRLGIATDQVLGARNTDPAEKAALAHAFEPWRDADVVLAPLGLGNHVDHRLVRDAACLAFSPEQLGFYQDLPYGCWMPDEERASTTLALTAAMERDPLPPWNANGAVPQAGSTAGLKLQYARCYPSQIADDQCLLMEADAAKRNGGETMCLPGALAQCLTAWLQEGTGA